jgi:hypothetical protein
MTEIPTGVYSRFARTPAPQWRAPPSYHVAPTQQVPLSEKLQIEVIHPDDFLMDVVDLKVVTLDAPITPGRGAYHG